MNCQSANPKVNKLLYLHNQLWGKKRQKNNVQNGKSILSEQRVEDHSKSLRPEFFTMMPRFLPSLQNRSLEVRLHSALLHILCPSKTVQPRMPSRCQACQIACPCTIKPHMKAPQYMHEIYRASYLLIKFVGAR